MIDAQRIFIETELKKLGSASSKGLALRLFKQGHFAGYSLRTVQRMVKWVKEKENAVNVGLKVHRLTEALLSNPETFDSAMEFILPKAEQDRVLQEYLEKGNSIGTRVDKKPEPYYTVIMGCRHMPFHDQEQLNADVELIRHLLSTDNTVDLILNGDILDMHSISRHMHKKKLKIAGLTLEKEYENSYAALSVFEDMPLRNKTYMWGNHETWYWTYMGDLEKTKLGNLLPKPSDLFDASWVKMEDYVNDYVMVGDLRVIHGVFVSVHAAKSHLDKFKGNILFAHTHRMQQFTDSHGDETITAYNIGWGGDAKSPVFSYMSALERSSWQQGVAVAYTDEQGKTTVQMLQWHNGQYVFGDKVVTSQGVKSNKQSKAACECY